MSGIQSRSIKLVIAVFQVGAIMLVANGVAHADLVLTVAGVADGFTLSKYATGVGGYSFLAAAPLENPNVGTLAVIDNAHGLLRSYADVNGQTYGSDLNSISFSNAINIADAGGVTYATRLGVSGGIYAVSNSLGLTPVTVTGGFTPLYGFAGNGVTGHLEADGTGSAGSGIYDINPLTGANTLIAAAGGNFFDGVSVSPDGTIVYAESNANSILGYNIATHAQVFSHSSTHSPDGTGVISGGTFNGYIIANNNDGTVGLIDPTGATETIIASGGTRGDFTSPDANDGSLLLSEEDFSYRLGAPGGSFTPPAVPEPSSITMLAGVIGVLGCGWWRRRKQAV
jgi:hypothetical protein